MLSALDVLTLLLIFAALFRLQDARIAVTWILMVRMMLKVIVSDIIPIIPHPNG